MGVTVLEDGSIAACSKFGVIMITRMKEDSTFLLMDTLLLPKYATAKPSHVSNSISSDGQMIFIASQREMIRVDYDPAMSKLVFKWSNVYGPASAALVCGSSGSWLRLHPNRYFLWGPASGDHY